MKTITRPPAQIVGEDKRHFGFDDFVLYLVNNDRRFNSDGAGIRSSVRIERALREASQSDVSLEDEDHKRLAEVVEAPSCAYPLTPARGCAEFIEAITTAK